MHSADAASGQNLEIRVPTVKKRERATHCGSSGGFGGNHRGKTMGGRFDCGRVMGQFMSFRVGQPDHQFAFDHGGGGGDGSALPDGFFHDFGQSQVDRQM